MAQAPAPPASPGPSPAGAPDRPPTTRGDRPGRWSGRLAAGAAGLAAAALALGTGELVAGLDDRLRSPVEAVASEVIDRAPRPVERFAIETFGTDDKLALVIGVVALSGVLGIVLGLASRRRPLVGTLGMAAFGLVGALASWATPDATVAAAVPSLVAAIVGAVALRVLVPVPAAAGRAAAEPPDARAAWVRGRAFLGLTAAVAGVGRGGGAGGRALRSRFSAAESRAGCHPAARRPAPAPGAADGRGRRRRHHPLRHAQRRLLPRRHGADRAPGARRGLDPLGHAAWSTSRSS